MDISLPTIIDFQGGPSTALALMPFSVEKSGSDPELPINDLNFKIVIGNQDANNTMVFDWQTFGKNIQDNKKTEQLLIEAIRNFIRKINFSELNESLINAEITNEHFDAILNENPDKYAITLSNFISNGDAYLIMNILDKIGYDLREFSTSEVAEMFSVNENELIKLVTSLKSQYKING